MPSFFFNDTATTEIYTLSLHDALPIFRARRLPEQRRVVCAEHVPLRPRHFPAGGSHRAVSDAWRDRKSTRLNSSHANISYAVFCLKKKIHGPGAVLDVVLPPGRVIVDS